MDAQDPRHGTEAGFEQHLRDDEESCHDCYEAKLKASRRRTKRKTMGHLYTTPLGPKLNSTLDQLRERGATHEDIAEWAGIATSQAWRICRGDADTVVYTRTRARLAQMVIPEQIVTPVGITRRVQALHWLGYSALRISAETGVHVDTVRDCADEPRVYMAKRVRESIAAAYERLQNSPAAGATQQERAGVTRAKGIAARKGYLPPLAWDDIDDPNEQPNLEPAQRNIVADRIEDIEFLADQGGSLLGIAARVGMDVHTLRDTLRRAGRQDLYWRLVNREPDAEFRRKCGRAS